MFASGRAADVDVVVTGPSPPTGGSPAPPPRNRGRPPGGNLTSACVCAGPAGVMPQATAFRPRELRVSWDSQQAGSG